MSDRRWLSPLRYPGGKVRMMRFLSEMYTDQHGWMDISVWMEPFSGGAGAGLAMIDAHVLDELWLVERNPALAALWRAILDEPEPLARRVETTDPSMVTWEWARERVAQCMVGEVAGDCDTGFAALVVNRCSRSGIIAPRVGPIGGKHQTGRWRINSRFNGSDIAGRIRHIATFGTRIRFYEDDGITMIADLADSGIENELVLFVDPPYFGVGNDLYAHGMTLDQHARLAQALRQTPARWMLTYDAHPLVTQMYPDHRILEFEIAHTANQQRVDTEYAVFSNNLIVNAETPQLLQRGTSRWIVDAGVLTQVPA